MSVTDLRAVWPSSCGLKGVLLKRRRNIKIICVLCTYIEYLHDIQRVYDRKKIYNKLYSNNIIKYLFSTMYRTSY